MKKTKESVDYLEHINTEFNGYQNLNPTKPSQKKPKKNAVLNACLTIFSILFVIGSLLFYYFGLFSCDYTTRVRVGEGLALASSAKNLVVDNAVNGFPFANEWQPFTPTLYTRDIYIDDISGAIFIVGDPERTKGVVLVLVPIDAGSGQGLKPGDVPKGYIQWKCQVVTLGASELNQLPAECRTMVSGSL